MLDLYRFMLIPERDAVNITMIGDMKTGKTTVVKHFINTMVKHQGKPVLLLDTGRQADYDDIKSVKLSDMKAWGENKDRFQDRNQIVKVQISIDPDKARNKQTAEFDKFCVYANLYLFNCSVVIEDALSYISINPPSSYKQLIRNSRNNGIDLLQNMHAPAEIPIVLYDNTQVFFVKHTQSEFPPKATRVAPFQRIKDELARMNEIITARDDNPKFYHYATVEYIADPAFRKQYNSLNLSIPLDSF